MHNKEGELMDGWSNQRAASDGGEVSSPALGNKLPTKLHVLALGSHDPSHPMICASSASTVLLSGMPIIIDFSFS